MDHGIFLELLIILSASLAVIALFNRLGLPPTLGYLGTGLLLYAGRRAYKSRCAAAAAPPAEASTQVKFSYAS